MPEDRKVETAHFGNKVNKDALLRDILYDPDIDAVAVVCLFKDGRIKTGWSNGIDQVYVAGMGQLLATDAIHQMIDPNSGE